MKRCALVLFLAVVLCVGLLFVHAVAAGTACATSYPILVDGRQVSFDAYALKDSKGNDTNYLKLRDVAYVLNGTPAQFDVGWSNGVITITTGVPYTSPNGSEMSTPFTGSQSYTDANGLVRVDGDSVDLDAILLQDHQGNGYTYFKIRDLGAALGFAVDWSPQDGIMIDTSNSSQTNSLVKEGTYQTYLEEEWPGNIIITDVQADGSFVFDIGWYRAYGFSARAVLRGNVATFTKGYYGEYGDEESSDSTIRGTLTFREDETVLFEMEPSDFTDAIPDALRANFLYFTEEELANQRMEDYRSILLINNDTAVWAEEGGDFYIRFFEDGRVRYFIQDVDGGKVCEGTYTIAPNGPDGSYGATITIDGAAYSLFAEVTGMTYMWLDATGADSLGLAGNYELKDRYGYYYLLSD